MSYTVLQIIPALGEGGVERGAVDVALFLKSQGHHPVIASSDGAFSTVLKAHGIEWIKGPFGQKTWAGFRQARKILVDYLSDHQVDVIHGRSRLPGWHATHLAKRFNKPLVTTIHGMHGGGWMNLKHLYNRSIVGGDKVIAISNTVAKYAKRHFPECASKLVIVPRWVDLDAYPLMSLADQNAQRLLMNVQKPLIVMPARITRWKGQKRVLEALSRVQMSMHVVFIGKVDDIDYFNECQSLSDALTQHDIEWQPPSITLNQLLSVSNAVIAASTKPEPFGRIPLEAAAVGSWMIAPDHGGFSETIKHQNTGYLYQPNQLDDLVRALESIPAKDEQSMRLMRDHAEQFSLQAMCGQVLKVYQQVI